MWTLPGGGIEFGEAPDAAVRPGGRGGDRARRPHHGHADDPVPHGHLAALSRPVRYHHVRFVYPMEVVGGSERVEVDGSTDACGWFTQEAVADLPIVGLVSLALGLPVRPGEDEVEAVEASAS